MPPLPLPLQTPKHPSRHTDEFGTPLPQVFTVAEQEAFLQYGYSIPRIRCKACSEAKKLGNYDKTGRGIVAGGKGGGGKGGGGKGGGGKGGKGGKGDGKGGKGGKGKVKGGKGGGKGGGGKGKGGSGYSNGGDGGSWWRQANESGEDASRMPAFIRL